MKVRECCESSKCAPIKRGELLRAGKDRYYVAIADEFGPCVDVVSLNTGCMYPKQNVSSLVKVKGELVISNE